MYYHLVMFDDKGVEKYLKNESDISNIENIINDFKNNKFIHVNGYIFNPKDITRIKVIKTERTLLDTLSHKAQINPIIGTRYLSLKDTDVFNDEDLSKDISNEYFKDFDFKSFK